MPYINAQIGEFRNNQRISQRRNPELTDYRDLVKYIYSKSSDFFDGKNPLLYGYYVCCGIYNGQADFEAKRKKSIDKVLSQELVSEYDYFHIDRKSLINLYKDTKSKPEVVINIEQKLTLPKVEKISDAYLCISHSLN